MEMKHPRRYLWENALLVVVFLAMLGFLAHSYFLEQKVYKQKTLHYQLIIVRQGIMMFNLVERRYPKSLLELAASTYRLPGEKVNRRYVERFPIDKEGQVLDPFGHPYISDKDMGWVRTSTPGYEYW